MKRRFTPTNPLNLSKADTLDKLLKQMSFTSFGARSLGEAADVLYQMTKDKDCFVVLTLSGAMTIAKMGSVACEMIDNKMVDAVVSTGAIIVHGIVEEIGKKHFKTDSLYDDLKLYYGGYDRVYDTLEREQNFDRVEKLVTKVLKSVPRDKTLSSVFINKMLGRHLASKTKIRGILKSAYRRNIPIYIPAFTDSEIGLDIAIFNRRALLKKEKPFIFDPFSDLEDFRALIEKQRKLGIFTVGGGVPRNWAQQIGPYLDILRRKLNEKTVPKRYLYAVRICPEPTYLGGLSGCTYSEGVSWGKFIPQSKGGRWAEVYADATIAWPLIVKAVMERLGAVRK